MQIRRVELGSSNNNVKKQSNSKKDLTIPKFSLPKMQKGNLEKDTVSFGSPVINKRVIWRNTNEDVISNLASFIDKFEENTAWMRKSDLGRRLVKDTIEDRKVAERNHVSSPKIEFEKSISTGFFSHDKYNATYLGGGVSGDAYLVRVDGVTRYVIKEAKDKKCSDNVDGHGGIKHEFEMLEEFEPNLNFQQGIALMKTEDGNYFLVSHFANGSSAGINENSFKTMNQKNIENTLDILKEMDNKDIFNPDWNLGNIFYDNNKAKVLDLQWAYPKSWASGLFCFTSEENITNFLPFEGGAIASYIHHLYYYTKSKTQPRNFLKMYLQERANYCDTSNRFEKIRKAVYQKPSEDVLDAEILRLSILKNHIHQFLYTDKKNEEPRDMLKMIRYQARANFAAKMLSEFQPQKPENQISDDEKKYFEEMRDFGTYWHNRCQSWYKGSIEWMRKLVTGEEKQTTGLYRSTGLFYWPKLFGTGVDGDKHPAKNFVPDKTMLSDVLSDGAKAKWDEVMEKTETINYRGRNITLPSLKTQIITFEGKFMALKKAVDEKNSNLKCQILNDIEKLVSEVLI